MYVLKYIECINSLIMYNNVYEDCYECINDQTAYNTLNN